MSLSNGLRNEHLHEDEAAELQASVDEISQRTGSERAKALGIAALFLENNQNLKAFEVLQHLINSGDDSVSDYYYLGEVYENANQFDRAKENYKIAARLASEALCAATAGLARVETEPNQRQTRLLNANAAFEALREITNEDFVPVRCEEQKGYTVDLIGQLLPEADNEEKRKQLLLVTISQICGSCGPGQALLPGSRICPFCGGGMREQHRKLQ